jgi:hypothetical protein
MSTYKALGDVITAIQNRSQGSVVYTVVNPSTVYPGFIDVLRNGVRTWSFQFSPVPGGAAWSGAGTDANPTGALIEVIGPDGVSGKADCQLFINSLN